MQRDDRSIHTARPLPRFEAAIRAEAAAEWLHHDRRDAAWAEAAERSAAPVHDRPHDRLVAAAALLPEAPPIDLAITRTRHLASGVAIVVVLLSALGGGVAVAGALSSEPGRPVNVFWLLGGVLGGQTLLLLGWLTLTLAGGERWSIGGVVQQVVAWRRRPGGATSENPARTALRWVVQTRSAALWRTPLGRWQVGALSNQAWLAFNLAGLLAATLLLSVRQVDFAWETTILSIPTYVTIAEAIGRLPGLLGFTGPDLATIKASRFDPAAPSTFPPQSDEVRAAWSRLLIGSVIAYGVLPRAALVALCWWRRRVWMLRFEPQWSAPAVVAALRHLQPAAAAGAPSDPIEIAHPREDASDAGERPAGPPAIAAIEIETPRCGWPPPLGRVVEDLGRLDSGAARQRAIERVRTLPSRPDPLLLVVDLVATPDRGLAVAIARLAEAAGGATLLLSGGERLRRREPPHRAAQRLDDWQRLARETLAAHGRVVSVELDLDHLTTMAATRMWQALDEPKLDGPESASGAGAMAPVGVSAAFDESLAAIATAAATWGAAFPDPAAAADLHRRIARIYEAALATGDDAGLRWPVPPLNLRDPAGSLARAAERIGGLLPPTLASSARWAIAGAAAGALGCIAATAMVSPLAISALPLWSAVGGAVSALLSAARARHGVEAPTPGEAVDLFEPVAAALLQAILFERQGAGEAAIARSLEQAVPEGDAPPLRTLSEVRGFLAAVRQRLASSDEVHR